MSNKRLMVGDGDNPLFNDCTEVTNDSTETLAVRILLKLGHDIVRVSGPGPHKVQTYFMF